MSELSKLGSLSNVQGNDSKIPHLPSKNASKEKLQKAAKEFESVFMDLVMKSMRDTIKTSDVEGDGENVKFFQSMLDSEYSKITTSSKHGIGLADAIVRQLGGK